MRTLLLIFNSVFPVLKFIGSFLLFLLIIAASLTLFAGVFYIMSLIIMKVGIGWCLGSLVMLVVFAMFTDCYYSS